MIRRASASFVKADRFHRARLAEDWLEVVPDLIIDVISPNDLAYRADRKIETFIFAGVPLIWIVNPHVRTVRVIRADGSTPTVRDGDTLSGEDIIPGFTCPVSSIFPLKPSIAAKSSRSKRKA